MRRPRLLAIPLLLALAACELITGPASRVNAVNDPPNVVVINRGERPIYYFAIEQDAAARTFWGACDNPETCDAVAPGGRREIPYESISGYSPEAEVILVYWWHLVARTGGGFEPDSIRFEEVRL